MSREQIINIPTQNSSDKNWISWYDSLKKHFGRKKANALFSANWDSKKGDSSDANTTTLRNYMSDNGVEISGGFFGEAKDKAFDVANFFGDYFTIGKYIGVGLAGVVALSIGAFVFQLATRSSVRKEAVDIGTAIGTRGMSKIGKK